MNKEQLDGVVQIVAGKLQQAAANLIDDPEMFVRGSRKEVAGRRLKGLGDVKERIQDYRQQRTH